MFLKKTFGLGAALVVCAAGCAFALTDAEYKTLMKNDEFKAADAQLNTAWKLAKSRLTPAEFEKLKAEQKKWLARGRDAAAQRSIKEYETPKAEAYAMVTEERAAEITKSANVSYLKRNPNWVQGYYVRDDKNEPGTLQVFWDGPGAKTVRVNLNVVLDLGGDNIREGNLNGEGTLNGSSVTVADDDEPSAKLNIKFTGDAAEVTAPPEFYESGFVGQGVTVGGTYRRVTAK